MIPSGISCSADLESALLTTPYIATYVDNLPPPSFPAQPLRQPNESTSPSNDVIALIHHVFHSWQPSAQPEDPNSRIPPPVANQPPNRQGKAPYLPRHQAQIDCPQHPEQTTNKQTLVHWNHGKVEGRNEGPQFQPRRHYRPKVLSRLSANVRGFD